MKKKTEITWSIMHPVRPEPDYMRQVLAAAAAHHVDSFEVCGDCHSWSGSIEGGIRFRDYPAAAARLDMAALDGNIRLLREVVDMAHQSGRPMYYWHREVMVPRAVVESVPGLLDENGEFNLLGEPYHDLLRSKVREFFDNIPGMDGLVLTLTESDYTVIHNSDQRRYPPAEVVRKVITTFAEEVKRLGKRFILRSFGSTHQDYEDIIEGARLVDPEFSFEIETKITPFDFSPFLPLNDYLSRTGRFTRSAEYDSIGEFLGAGFLPAADPNRVIECVNFARQHGVDRHTIRIDRIGHGTFASTQAVNLLAFDRAIHDPSVTAQTVWSEWAAAHWPDCPAEMTAVMQRGIEMVKKTHFIDGHVIFHAFPIHADWKWIKSCGILSIFKPGVSLEKHQGMWGILPDKTTPAREVILQEKDAAVRIADEGLAGVRKLQARLSPEEFALAETAWSNATVVTRLIRNWTRCVCAYFEDMESARPDHPALSKAAESVKADFENFLRTKLSTDLPATGNKPGQNTHEYGDPDASSDTIETAYGKPLWRLIQLLLAEYAGELAERNEWRARAGVVDLVLCGSITDDYRVHRYMHASHSCLSNGRPARIVGNRVFPNGFVECHLALPAEGNCRLVIKGEPAKSKGFLLTLNGKTQGVAYDADGFYECPLFSAQPGGDGKLTVRLQKTGADYPWIYGMATVAGPA